MTTYLLAVLSHLTVPAGFLIVYVFVSPRFSERAKLTALRVASLMIFVSAVTNLWTGATFHGVVLIVIAALFMAEPHMLQWIAARRDAKQTGK